MKKIYFAKRIPKNSEDKFILDINESMSPDEIYSLYVKKQMLHGSYIYNGHWILRPPTSENRFLSPRLPGGLTPFHVWQMVKKKMDESDVVVGTVNPKSYGTIAEVGYACNCGNTAVYVLPENTVSNEDLSDLWFVFQMALSTRSFWSDTDIESIGDFSFFNITSISDYLLFIENIIPAFMKK